MLDKKQYDSDVIIVGAGPVGVALSIELSLFGITSIILEKHEKPLQLPKGQLLNPDTMNYFQRLDIAEAITHARLLPAHFPLSRVYCSSLNGELLAYQTYEQPHQKKSSSHYERLPLWITENILRTRASLAKEIDLRLNFKFLSLQQKANGVQVTAENTEMKSEKISLVAPIVCGCDGANSMVREFTDITLELNENLGDVRQINFTADILENSKMPIAIRYYFYQDGIFGSIGAIDGKYEWFADVPIVNDLTDKDTISDQSLIEQFAGFPISIKKISSHVWQMRNFIANKFYDNRVILAGDAAHSICPINGDGLNLGIADVKNLGEKINALLTHEIYALTPLENYTRERKPIIEKTTSRAKEIFLQNAQLTKDYFLGKCDAEQFKNAIDYLAAAQSQRYK